ncbi:hypothetical protein Nepgr_012070 [Nepenthes gracilis]|uniref:Transcription repressor n=1 Tax=Nepenthes gracilis TaxID=150966 RepID=A0AAD3XMU4_NEPGR|nr:hypothetical protein Nepgr_012070 [Nepenthes gracilis]
MGVKEKLPSLIFNPRDYWPSCKLPKTLSFRTKDDIFFKTLNSVYFDNINDAETPESWFTDTSNSASFSTESEGEPGGEPLLETIIRGVQSERLFFEPGETSSILEEANHCYDNHCNEARDVGDPFAECVVLAVDSDDPYRDFRGSMEEIAASHGGLLRDWGRLEELLGWYLRVNGKESHGYVVAAFVDFLGNYNEDESVIKSGDSNCCEGKSGAATCFCSAASSFSSCAQSPTSSLVNS